MSYKDILVVTDDTPECEERINIALRLAARHAAHVMGLMVRERIHVPEYAKAHLPPAYVDEQRLAADAVHARVRQKFEGLANAAGVANEWHTTEGDPVSQVALYSRHTDVSVIGQHNPQGGGYGTVSDLAEHVVLASGRPVLAVPYVGTYPTVGARVMVAWDASREAARAVADALPVLRGAEHVAILSANPGSGTDGEGRIPGADIARHLARHGVKVVAERVSADDVPIADLILNHITDEGIDLVVMGAYGHARIRELWLGGVTRRLMRNMTAPVLFSH